LFSPFASLSNGNAIVDGFYRFVFHYELSALITSVFRDSCILARQWNAEFDSVPIMQFFSHAIAKAITNSEDARCRSLVQSLASATVKILFHTVQ
jgi:hypothetical protein